jgi:hypothetical protein
MTDQGEAARAQQLYDEGAAMLAGRWDEDAGLVRYETPAGVFHDARGSLAYAEVLLRNGGDDELARAAGIIIAVESMQERNPEDAHCGNFRWFFEDPCVTDLNAVEFVLDGLNAIAVEFNDRLPVAAADAVRRMVELGLEEIDALDVHVTYTNIYLSDVCNRVLGGELLRDESRVAEGVERLHAWLDHTMRNGAPHEFNSPTYAAVDIARMAMLAEQAADANARFYARMAEELLWNHSAHHFHPALAKLAGPHSRSYRDGWTGAPGYLTLALWRITGDERLRAASPWFDKGREEGHTGVARNSYHLSPYAASLLREKTYPYECVETVDEKHGLDITTYMSESFALGAASRSWAVGEPPEPWPQPNSILLHFARDGAPGFGTLFARYVVNDKGPGAIMHESNRTAEDWWEEGVYVAAQHRNRAIVACGLRPRVRPARSYKLTVQLLGAEPARVFVDDERVRQFPVAVPPGRPIVIAEGGVYIALTPLEPTDMGHGARIALDLQGDALSLHIENYRGPDKSFWEYRSLGGPFFKGNVLNGFAIEVAEQTEFADLGAFREYARGIEIVDAVDASGIREVAYASPGGTLAMRYSLLDMSVVSRSMDGVPIVVDGGRAGALDGSGAQWRLGDTAVMELPGLRVVWPGAVKWAASDEAGGRHTVAGESEGGHPVYMETPGFEIETETPGWCRIQIDDRTGLVELDAVAGPVSCRIRHTGKLKVTLRGKDVTHLLRGTGEPDWQELVVARQLD